MNDQLFSVENKICIVTGGLGQIGDDADLIFYAEQLIAHDVMYSSLTIG